MESRKELSKKNPVRVTRHGYEGSGFVFYFVECYDRKALKNYAMGDPRNASFFENGDLPFGLSYSARISVLPNVFPEARDTNLWVAYLLVASTDDKYTLLARDVRRHWNHEIGHTVQSFLSEYVDDWPECPRETYNEAAAYCNEFLGDCLDALLGNMDRKASSGLPLMFPWTEAGRKLAEEEKGMTK